MSKFEETLNFFFDNCQDFDTGLAGMIGELFAIEKLGMIKAPRGSAGFDGWINGRKVSVKTRQPNNMRLSAQYAGVKARHVGLADDLLSISIREDRSIEYRLAPFSDWQYSETKDGNEYRYKLNKIQPIVWSDDVG
jgi:hypothetical protein